VPAVAPAGYRAGVLRLAVLLIVSAALAAASPVVARPTRARTLEQAADEERRQGRLPEAFAAYKQAWIAHPAPRYLYRLGQCEHLRGDDERALFFFQRYLDKRAIPPFKAKVERHVAEAHQKIAAARVTRKTEGETPRLAVMPMASTAKMPALAAERMTEQLHALVTKRRPGRVRDLDSTYVDLHLASLVELECVLADEPCLRSLMPLFNVDELVVVTSKDEQLTLRIVSADASISSRQAKVLRSQVSEGVRRVLP